MIDPMIFIIVPIIIILAVGALYAFGYSAMIAQKIARIFRIEEDSFLEWIVMVIFVSLGFLLFDFLAGGIFGIF